MCTAFNINYKGNIFFGRNMDIEYNFNQSVNLVPRNYAYKSKGENKEETTKYAITFMGTVIEGFPLIADGINEKGLVMAGLNFPHFCHYEEKPQKSGKLLSPCEVLLYALGNFATVNEVKTAFKDAIITTTPFSDTVPNTPLHFVVVDKGGQSIVIEQTKAKGLIIYDNKVGVLTNAPTYDWHIINLCQYLGLSPHLPNEIEQSAQKLKPLGQGVGAVGLPGDFSPASRFVRTAYLKGNLEKEEDFNPVSNVFHILGNVSMIKGSVITPTNESDITTYSACIDVENAIYYYSTYDNLSLKKVDMRNVELQGKEIISFGY